MEGLIGSRMMLMPRVKLPQGLDLVRSTAVATSLAFA